MEYILIGKIVNTHALLGEVRIISSFEYKSKVFKINNKLYIGKNKSEEVIESYRVHKNFDMVKFINIDSINDVIKYKGENVYINKEDLKLNNDEILMDDLIGMSVYSLDKLVGKVEDYINKNIIIVSGKMIPYNKELINKIDKQNKIIYYKDIDYILEAL